MRSPFSGPFAHFPKSHDTREATSESLRRGLPHATAGCDRVGGLHRLLWPTERADAYVEPDGRWHIIARMHTGLFRDRYSGADPGCCRSAHTRLFGGGRIGYRISVSFRNCATFQEGAFCQLAICQPAMRGNRSRHVRAMAHQILSPQSMDAWGWRLPLVAGCLIIPFLYVLRRSLPETQSFARRSNQRSGKTLIRQVVQAWPIIGSGALMVVMTTVSFYLITAYTPTFGKVELKLSSEGSFLVTLLVGATNFFWLIVMGSVSDRVGRRGLLFACLFAALIIAYPAINWLVSAPSFDRLLVVELWLSFIYGSYNAAMVVYLTEVVPAEVSASAFSVAYSIATALFGGFTPTVCTYLIQLTGDQAAPGAWLSAAAVTGLIGVLITGRLSTVRQSERRVAVT
jgi:hypothetical protein